MQDSQPGILAAPLAVGRSLSFRLALETDPAAAVRRLRHGFDPDWGVVGLGEPLVRTLGGSVPGLRPFPSLAGPGCAVPATQQALWVFVRGRDRTDVFDRSDRVVAMVKDGLLLDDVMDTFGYDNGRDLIGYMDGTANPSIDDSVGVAIVAAGAGMAGSSFVGVQRWVHDLPRFRAHSQAERDDIVGRRQDTNEEFAEAPASSHVKRTAQEDFTPPAYLVRRSMPFSTGLEHGLEFIAYGHTLDFFERSLRRMVGLDDGIVDALFRISRPVTGGYYWCPPLAAGRLDLSLLGIR